MAVTPWKSPTGAGRPDGEWGVIGGDWTVANLSAAGDGLVATDIVGSADGTLSAPGWVYGFGFDADVPAGATIDGIGIRHKAQPNPSSARQSRGNALYLVLDGATGTPSGTNQTSATILGTEGVDGATWVMEGGAADLFGLSLTRAQIADPAFGAYLRWERYHGGGATNNANLDVDAVEMQVHYTEGGGSGGATGAGTGGFDAQASASGAVSTSGHGAAGFAASSDATGAVEVSGTASGGFDAQSSGSASTGITGAAAGGFEADASGGGSAAVTGSGEGGFSASATSEGSALQPGGGAASGSFTASAGGTGEVGIAGQGSAGFSSTASASGDVAVSGDASGGFSAAGEAVGQVAVTGQGSGAFDMSASGAATSAGGGAPDIRAPDITIITVAQGGPFTIIGTASGPFVVTSRV
ncbi:hypothetical protein [Limimaricola sp.]|uniref:hypothetical protein n=1 Tax=Limimaricola sp. TaxID=2211665 RepID=UPI004058C1E9